MAANKTSIVLPLGRGSRNNDLELRYCLRSIENYLTGYGDIFIVGEYPDWLQGCIHIPCPDYGDKTYDKERNIFGKILEACADDRVTDNFMFMNDDHYLRETNEAGKFPYYYEGLLTWKRTVTDYKHTVQNTVNLIGGDALYADIHCPIIYNKKSFSTLASYDWSVSFGYCIKTLYCKMFVRSWMTPQKDCKLDDQIKCVDGRPWFSIGDKAFRWDVRALLQELYPNPSKFEKRK